MVRKRHHTKSRNGCDGCKKRRVKCDEIRPNCTNCVSREVDCHFSRPASVLRSPPGQNTVLPEPDTLQPAASTSGPIADVNQGLLRLRELELMHQWCTKTCFSFTADMALVFQSYVPKEAIKHEFLMDSMLALASLHLASETDDLATSTNYVALALQYQNKALSAFYLALRDITPSNCDAIFAAAIITMASAVVSPMIPTNNESTESITESLLLLMDFIKGIGSVVEHSRHWLKCGPLTVLLTGKLDMTYLREDENTILPIRHLRHMNDEMTGITNITKHNIYEHAIRQLERCFMIDRTMAMTWLVEAGNEFVQEFRSGEPMAQLVFMYLGVVFDGMDDMWWAKYSGKRLVKELAKSLLSRGDKWATATKWAMVQVGCENALNEQNDMKLNAY